MLRSVVGFWYRIERWLRRIERRLLPTLRIGVVILVACVLIAALTYMFSLLRWSFPFSLLGAIGVLAFIVILLLFLGAFNVLSNMWHI